MFSGTKAKISQQVNDRVTAPIKTALTISLAALLIAGLALIVAAGHAR